ncbi:MAG: c-type cytochrome [Methylophaga sp.]|nr:c-type cytochrome [Methylophaga sp.]
MTMKHLAYTLFGLTALFSAQSVLAGDAAAGKAKAALCAACHGANGIATMPAYPNLAGQNEPYLVSSLKAYRDKQRNGGMAAIMQMQAASLSDDDIDNIAAHFSGLK